VKTKKICSVREHIAARASQRIDGEITYTKINADVDVIFRLNFLRPVAENTDCAKWHVWWDSNNRYRVVRSVGFDNEASYVASIGKINIIGKYRSLERALFAIREWHVQNYLRLGVAVQDEEIADNIRQTVREAEEYGLDMLPQVKETSVVAESNGVAESEKNPYVLFGMTVSSVLRAMGKMGLDADEARKVLKAKGISLNEDTLASQVRAGSKGQRGAPARLTKDQKEEILSLAGRR
jgi:hypothetical protein